MESDYIRNHLAVVNNNDNYCKILEVFADGTSLISEIHQFPRLIYTGIFSSPESIQSIQIPEESLPGSYRLIHLPEKHMINELGEKFDLIILRDLPTQDIRQVLKLLKICKTCLTPEGEVMCCFSEPFFNTSSSEITEDAIEIGYLPESVYCYANEGRTYIHLRRKARKVRHANS